MSVELSGDLPAAETTERPRVCQAQGCEVDVNPHGRYCRKRRLCPEHLKAPSLCRKKSGNEKWRFCQQCGKLELIGNFDGLKRSCRVQLARRRAANNKGGAGERRRSQPSRSTDKTSSDAGSERMSEDGTPVHAPAAAAAAASRYAADGQDTGPGYAAAAAAAAADAGAGIAPAAAVGYWSAGPAEHQEGGMSLPSGMELAAYLQQGFDNALLHEQQQQRQLLQQQQRQPSDAGQLLQQQQRQQGLFGLQQQQEQVRQSAVSQPAVGTEQGNPAALNPAVGPYQPPGVHASGSDLLLQLLRERQHQQQVQQLRGWQQQQSSTHEHADIYSIAALETGDSSGLASASGDSLRSMQAHQRQQSLQQHSTLLPQRRSLDDAQSFPAAAAAAAAMTRSTSSGSFPAGMPDSAGLQPPGGLTAPQPAVPSSLPPGMVKAEPVQLGQFQFMQAGFEFQQGAQAPSSAPMPLMPVGSGGGSALPGGMNMHGMAQLPQGLQAQQLQPQQQQQQRQAAAEQFALGVGGHTNQQGWGRPAAGGLQSDGGLPDFEGLKDMIAAAVGGAGRAALARQDALGNPSELRSLSAASAQNLLLNARQQLQPQLREFDSAPAGLTLPSDQSRRPADCMDTYNDLLALGSMPMGLLEQQQQPQYGAMQALGVGTSAGLAGPAGGVYVSTGMGLAGHSHALPMTTPASVAAAISGQGGLLQTRQQVPGMLGAGAGAPAYPLPLQQQGGSVMGGQGGQLLPGAAAAGMMVQQLQQSQQQLAAELQALLDGAVSSPLMHS